MPLVSAKVSSSTRALRSFALVTALVGSAVLAQPVPETFVYQTVARALTLDPAQANDLGSAMVVENLYETLFGFDGGSLAAVVPRLATSYSVSEDGLVWTFVLREGVRFHSGNTLGCKDVEYSFEYGAIAARPDSAFAALLGNRWPGSAAIGSNGEGSSGERGADGSLAAAATWEGIDAIVACPAGPSGLVVEIRLGEPVGALLAILAHHSFSIVDSDHASGGGAWDGSAETWSDWLGRDLTAEFLHANPSGTGAYRLEAWDVEGVRAVAFAEYWGDAPAFERVELRYVDDQATREQALTSGDATRIDLSERSSLEALAMNEGVAVHRASDWTFATITGIFFNFDLSLAGEEAVGSGRLDGNGVPSDFFADVDVRLAFAHLFDQAGFVEQTYGGNGVTLTAPLPPAFPGYLPDAEARSLDLEAAAEHFRAAFEGQLWEPGFKLTAYYNLGNTVRRDALEMVKANLEAVNPRFRMDVKDLPWPEFLASVSEGRAPLFAISWGADFADPIAFVETFFSKQGRFAARTHVALPALQDLTDSAAGLTDPRARAAHFEALTELQHALAPLILVPLQTWFIVTRADLDGVYFNPLLAGQFLWRDVSRQ